jgi:hypothetical protein
MSVNAPAEDKCNDKMYSFYEELERVFDQSPKYYMKIVIGDFNARVGRERMYFRTENCE